MLKLHTRIWSGLLFEKKSYKNNFTLPKIVLYLVLLIQAVVFSFSDVESSVISLIRKLKIIKIEEPIQVDPFIILAIILVIYLIIWLLDNESQTNEETNLLRAAIVDYVNPGIDSQLNTFLDDLRQRYGFSSEVRASILLPVRVGFFQWRFQIVCRSKLVIDSELDLLLRFYEGAIGYAFLRSHETFIDLSSTQRPSGYVELTWDNQRYAKPGISGVTVLVDSRKGFITRILAIDTSVPADFSILRDPKLHSDAVNWMRTQRESIELVWRVLKDGQSQ